MSDPSLQVVHGFYIADFVISGIYPTSLRVYHENYGAKALKSLNSQGHEVGRG
jgi:hypothetical protein